MRDPYTRPECLAAEFLPNSTTSSGISSLTSVTTEWNAAILNPVQSTPYESRTALRVLFTRVPSLQPSRNMQARHTTNRTSETRMDGGEAARSKSGEKTEKNRVYG